MATRRVAALASRRGGAPRPCAAGLPSVHSLSKRGGFIHRRKCTPRHATVEGRSMHVPLRECMLLPHTCGWRHGVLQHLPAGVEARPGRARQACHRCTVSASVVASSTDASARLDMPPLKAARCTCHCVSACCYRTRADGDTACCSTCQPAWRRAQAVRGRPAIGAQSQQAWWLHPPTQVHASTCHR